MFKKEKVNTAIALYYIAMFISPIIAFLGLTLLEVQLMEIMDIIKITGLIISAILAYVVTLK